MPKLDHMTVHALRAGGAAAPDQEPRHRAVLQSLQCNADRFRHSRSCSNSSKPTAPSAPRWCSNSPRARSAPWGRPSTKALPRLPSAASASPWTTSPICNSMRANCTNAASASSKCRQRFCSAVTAPPRRDARPADLSGYARRLRRRSGRRAHRERKHRGRCCSSAACALGKEICSRRRAPVRAEALQGGNGEEVKSAPQAANGAGQSGCGSSRAVEVERRPPRWPPPTIRWAPRATKPLAPAGGADRPRACGAPEHSAPTWQ